MPERKLPRVSVQALPFPVSGELQGLITKYDDAASKLEQDFIDLDAKRQALREVDPETKLDRMAVARECNEREQDQYRTEIGLRRDFSLILSELEGERREAVSTFRTTWTEQEELIRRGLVELGFSEVVETEMDLRRRRLVNELVRVHPKILAASRGMEWAGTWQGKIADLDRFNSAEIGNVRGMLQAALDKLLPTA